MSQLVSKNLAFLGLGLMGGAMAANLAKKGFVVKGWNRTLDRPGVNIARTGGVAILPSLQETVTTAEIIFTCLGDVPDVEEVLLGATGVINWAQPNTLIVDFSTIGPQAAKTIHRELQTKGLRFLDAPVSGGDIGAQNGTLTIMVGGNVQDFEQCQPYFTAMGKNIRWCGEVGRGQAVKMCNQILCSLNLVGICEAMLLAEKQGLDPNLIVDVCGSGAAGSWALTNLGLKVAEGDFAPGFMIKHIVKDLRLVKENLGDSSDNLPGTELAEKLFKMVQELAGGNEQGTQAMMRAYRDN